MMRASKKDDPTHTPRIMVVSAGGIYISRDGGNTLPLLSDKMKGPCGSIALDPGHWDFFFTSYNQRGVFRTRNDGQSYENKSKGLTGFTIHDLLVSPQDPATVYATAQDVALFKTTNGGANWHELPVGISAGAISPLAADLTSEGRLYLGSFFSYFTAVNGGEAQGDWQMTSFNWGSDPNSHPDLTPAQFSSCPLREASAFAVAKGAAPGGKDRLYMGISYHGFWYPAPDNPKCQNGTQVPGMVIYASDDQGAHWTPVFTETNNYFPFTIVIDPTDPRRIFVGATDSVDNKYEIARIYYNLDGGVTWQNSGEKYKYRPTLLTVGKDHTLLTSFGSDFAYSKDYGKNWVILSKADAWINKIVYDPDVYGLYIGTIQGVRVSYDNGKTWNALPGSLGKVNITALAVRQVDNRTIIYASTPGMTIGGQASFQAQDSDNPTYPAAVDSQLISGGVYRYTVTKSTTYLPIIALKR